MKLDSNTSLLPSLTQYSIMEVNGIWLLLLKALQTDIWKNSKAIFPSRKCFLVAFTGATFYQTNTVVLVTDGQNLII